MVGGIFYEHGHRMVATFVGCLTVIMALWIWRVDPRAWVRKLGFLALGAVIAQGLLGGLTVIFLLPTAVSVAHACLAQTFFCITVSLAVFTSASWKFGPEYSLEVDDGSAPAVSIRQLSVLAVGATFVQLILGALVRHTESGLAIPDFPLSFGHVIPPFGELTADSAAPFPISTDELRTRVMIHFLHRSWAMVVAGMILWLVLRILRRHPGAKAISRPAALAAILVAGQVLLGGAVVWMGKAVAVTTAHVVVGASILATVLVVVLRVWQATETLPGKPMEGADKIAQGVVS